MSSDATPLEGTKPKLKFRHRWVCESGHTTRKTGPYQDKRSDAEAGGKAHDDADHGGTTTATIETSMVP